MKPLVFLIGLLVFAQVHAHKVIGIADGDTLTLLVDKKPLKIRLANIDAPERAQAFGQRSQKSLSDLCWGKDATYEMQDIDRYGRTVGVVTCAGVEANRAQVDRGMAWVYTKYNKDPLLLQIEQDARETKRGLWADPEPTPPWAWRRKGPGSGRSRSKVAYVAKHGRVQNGNVRLVPMSEKVSPELVQHLFHPSLGRLRWRNTPGSMA